MFEHLDDPRPFVPDERLRTRVKAQGRRRRARRRAGHLTGASLSVLLVATATVWLRVPRPEIDRFGLSTVEQTGPDGQPVSPVTDPGRPYTVLVVGTDGSRDVGGQRTDTIMLVRVDRPAGRVRVVSLPRDLWVPLAGGTSDRINSAWQHGPEALVRTVNRVFGVTVDHYVGVGFEGFTALVDAVGGVPLAFAAPLRDDRTGLHVPVPGCRVLDGRTALALTRSRHVEVAGPDGRWREDLSADLGRIARQQVVIQALAGRVLRPAPGVTDLPGLAALAGGRVVLDDRLRTDDLVAAARWAGSLPADAVTTATPPVRTYTTAGGAHVLEVDGDAAIVRRLLDGGEPGSTGSTAAPDGTDRVDPAVRVPAPGEPCAGR